MARLTDTQISGAKPKAEPYRLADGGALFLEIRPTGAKLWRYRYRIAGRQNIYAIGKYFDGKKKPPDHVSLEAARAERDQARKLVKQGIHPAHERQTVRLRQHVENSNTFEGVAKEWIEQNKPHWTSGYLAQVENMLKDNVFGYVGSLPIRSVTAAHLLEILQRVDKRGAKTVALLLRQWCSAIFRYAAVTLRADADPAAALKGSIKRNRVKHKTPLTRDEIPELLDKADSNANRATAIALRLLLYTFVRPGELRCAEWAEFDLERGEWRIPAQRMKMREMHIVPLADQAVALLRELKDITGTSIFLFPNYRRPDTVMTITTLNRALERMGFGGRFSAHGFRATASTFLNEMGYRPDLIERQLAHAERNKTRASYNQAEYLTERRKMMRQWANAVDAFADGQNITPLHAVNRAA
jgi:integrase